MPETLRGRAPAKVNLVLEVLGPREDGFHEIDTIFQELELADTLEVHLGDGTGLSVDGPFAAGTPADGTNLAWQAAELLAARVGESTADLRLHITTQIPPAGGLGGGASDAATVLRLLGQRWRGASAPVLNAVAAEVGSDEAFFLTGGTARGTGRGEKVEPLPALPPHDVVLFVPRFSIERKTARMFAALDDHAFDEGGVSAAFRAIRPERFCSSDVFNAFERVAFDLFPELASLWAELEGRTGQSVRLAGAGPTLFWIGPAGSGQAVANAASGAECTVLSTRSAGRR